MAWETILKRRTNPHRPYRFNCVAPRILKKKTKPPHVQARVRSAPADATVAIGRPAVQQDVLGLWAAFAAFVVRPEYLPFRALPKEPVSSFEMGLRTSEQQAAGDDHPKNDRAVRPDYRMP
jgi:hypothetical protein